MLCHALIPTCRGGQLRTFRHALGRLFCGGDWGRARLRRYGGLQCSCSQALPHGAHAEGFNPQYMKMTRY
eukprot:2928469-Pleurochrysis_carterae.AAC.1